MLDHLPIRALHAPCTSVLVGAGRQVAKSALHAPCTELWHFLSPWGTKKAGRVFPAYRRKCLKCTALVLAVPSCPKLPRQDSNLDKENQNLLCYRYTTG
jgi:hypothetical protein